MEIVYTLLNALWQQDFHTLSNPHISWLIYTILVIILVLENGLLPAAFLPGDSLLFLTGILIAKGSLNFPLTIVILTIGSGVGYWLGYLQGRWLSKTQLVQRWLKQLPEKYHTKSYQLLEKYGLMALLISRFTAFVRTLMPLLVGISGMGNRRFQFINWLSGLIWVCVIIGLSHFLSHTTIFLNHQESIISMLTLLPILLLLFGLLSSLILYWRSRK